MRVCAFCALRLFVSTCLVVPCACCFLMLASLAGWLHSSLGATSLHRRINVHTHVAG